MKLKRQKKIVRQSLIICFFAIHFLFLMFILVEQKAPAIILTAVAVITFSVLYSYFKTPLHLPDLQAGSWKVMLWLPVAAFTAFFLNQQLALGPVIAGSASGLAASFLPDINKKSKYLADLPEVMYCGAFVGMTSSNVTNSVSFILLASVITAFFFMFSKSLFQGIGGKAGTMAFIGVTIAVLLYKMYVSWIG